jgi:ERCC4-type nuclease
MMIIITTVIIIGRISHIMLITVDYRERELIDLFQQNLLEMESEMAEKGKNKEKGIEKIKIKVENLKLGDIVISDDDNTKEMLLFERKSLNDLASSIKDGRYVEQSYRLDGYESVPNHNIVYIIEGDLSKWKENSSRVNKKTLLSSMCSILYYKGFSVVRTMSMRETCELILNWTDKLHREKLTKTPYYSGCCSGGGGGAKMEKQESSEKKQESEESEQGDGEEEKTQSIQPVREVQVHYCDVLKIKKEKNSNITPDNIGEIMLCTIPGISSKTAIVIMKEYKTINGLIKSLEKDAHCLNNIYMETNANGKKRKISSQCIENIRNYLLGNI